MSENKDQRNSQRAKTFNQSGESTIEEHKGQRHSTNWKKHNEHREENNQMDMQEGSR